MVTTPADVAEKYPAADSTIEAGDIVMVAETISLEEEAKRERDITKLRDEYGGENIDPKVLFPASVARAESAYKQRIIGVISTQPGVLLSDTTGLKFETKFVPVALAGRIPVKVNNEGGEIKIGDKITISSVSGVGKKAAEGEGHLAISLENFSGVEGKVMAFINLGYSNLDNAATQLASSDASTTSGSSTFGEPWGISIDTGKVYTSYIVDLQNNDIIRVRNILSESGNYSISEAGKLIIEEIEAKRLKVESGVTTRDRATGEYYCIYVDNGVLTSSQGECAPFVENAPTADSAPATDGAITNESITSNQEIINSENAIPTSEVGTPTESVETSEPAPTDTTISETVSSEPTQDAITSEPVTTETAAPENSIDSTTSTAEASSVSTPAEEVSPDSTGTI